MKVIAKPIEMVAWFDSYGVIHPIRFKICEDDHASVIKISKIITRSKERTCGNDTIVFTCSGIIENFEKTFEVKYEIKTLRWILFKL